MAGYIPRIYLPEAFSSGNVIQLSKDTAHHIKNVMRLRAGDPLILFNGDGGYYEAEIVSLTSNKAEVSIKHYIDENAESPLFIHLGLAITKSERMAFALQKSVELGVGKITCLMTEFCSVKQNKEHLAKKLKHWQGVVVSACEQSGRNVVPVVEGVMSLREWCVSVDDDADVKILFDPRGDKKTNDLPPNNDDSIKSAAMLIGPEGGLSESELQIGRDAGFEIVNLGKRILRNETAAAIGVAMLQIKWGDF